VAGGLESYQKKRCTKIFAFGAKFKIVQMCKKCKLSGGKMNNDDKRNELNTRICKVYTGLGDVSNDHEYNRKLSGFAQPSTLVDRRL
jgi:uncharacterized membrane protein YvbJ